MTAKEEQSNSEMTPDSSTDVTEVKDTALKPEKPKQPGNAGMDFILDIPLEITVELGRTRMVVNDLLRLGQGSVVELSKMAGETLDILANRRLIAKGEVVVVNDKYGVRLTEVISPVERLEKLQ
ncbi:MAG TPA: flagellar motor switch protein FliN [Desulfobacterales bacterium]